ncbi:MAG: DUF5715 family protein [Candidatus Saccharibacteria bacterium]
MVGLIVVMFVLMGVQAETPQGLVSRPVIPQSVVFAPKADFQIPESKREALLKALPDSKVKELWLADYPALDRAFREGRLIALDSDSAAGFVLRKTGKWPIGEREPKKKLREKLYRLSPSAAGLLYYLSSEIRLAFKEEFQPLEITSLVRTARYQKSLAKVNGNARVDRLKIPPTHVLGLAFDIAWTKMPKPEVKELVHLLDDLSAEGKIVYFLEGAVSAAFHVVALPQAEQEFTQYYENAIARPANVEATRQ